MSIRLSCPSCNTSFTLPDLPADGRALCPRCGDRFPIHSYEEAAGAAATPVPPPSIARRNQARRSLMRGVIVLVGLGVLGLAAGLIAYNLRERDGVPSTEPASPPTASVVPAVQLTGLAYLPADDNVVLAIQPGPILTYAASQHLDPRSSLVGAGIPVELLDGLDKAGLSLSQIDHIAGGTSLGDDKVVLRFTLVIVFRHPPDESALLGQLKAREAIGKKRWEIELANLPASLARVSPIIWVFGMDNKDFQGVEHGGYGPGGTQLPPSLTAEIANRIPPTAAVWAAVADERWAEKPAIKLIAQMGKGIKKEWLAALAKGRGATIALSFDHPPRLHLFLRLADDKAAEQVRAYFARHSTETDGARHGGAGELAYYDAPTDPEKVLSDLKQLLADAVKP